MHNFTEFFIALRYLRSKHKSSFISVTTGFSMLGIILGVAALIVVMSVMNGYREELTKITLGVGGHIVIKGGPNGIVGYEDFEQEISKLPQVKKVLPQIERQVMAVNRSNMSGGILKGIDPQLLKSKTMVSRNVVEGSFKEFQQNTDAVLIGSSLAYSLGIKVGDELKIVTASTTYTVMGMVPRSKTFVVAGIFESGLYLYDNAYIYSHLTTAQKIYRMPNLVSLLEIEVDNPTKTKSLKALIAEKVKNLYRVEDWQQQNSQILSALEIERAVMFLILTLIIIVAAFNIISGLYMLVNEKKSDIAILRTYGASKLMIIRIFIYIGLIIGLFGTIIGVSLGVSFAYNIEAIRQFLETITATNLFDPVVYYLNQLPAKLDFNDIYRITILSIGLSTVATIFPALKASSTDPAQGLRNE